MSEPSRSSSELGNVTSIVEPTDFEDCYFPNDGYDYNQHLKAPGGAGSVSIKVVEKKGNVTNKAVIRHPPKVVCGKKLDELAGGGILAREEGVFDKDPREWTYEEKEIFEALENADEYEEIDDDFFTQVPDSKRINVEDIVWGGYKPEFVSGSALNNFLGGAASVRGTSAFGDWEKKSVASSKRSGKTAAFLGGERREILESKFDRILEEYDEDEIGELDEEEELEGMDMAAYEELFDEYLITKGKDINQYEKLEPSGMGRMKAEDDEDDEWDEDEEDEQKEIIEHINENGEKVTLVKMQMSKKARKKKREMEKFWGIGGDDDDEEEEDEYEEEEKENSEPVDREKLIALIEQQENAPEVTEIVEEEKKEEQWDCETILTTRSNLYNRPTKISKPQGKVNKIKIGGKLQLPVDYFPVGKKEREDTIPEEEEEDEDEEEEEEVPVIEVCTLRKRGETTEERKARKQAVKQAQRQMRELKKQTKETFKNEAKKVSANAQRQNPYDLKSGVRTFQI